MDSKRLPKVNDLPICAEDGAVIASAGKYARSAVLTAFEMLGGVSRMAEWAEENPGDFYTKLFTKVITKEVEHVQESSVEDALDRLDGEFEEVEDGE